MKFYWVTVTVTVTVTAGLALGLVSVADGAGHPGANQRTTHPASSASTGTVIEITGTAEEDGGPLAVGEKSPQAHGFVGLIALYTNSTATGRPALTASVSPTNDSYKFTLSKGGTFYLVAETSQGIRRASPKSVPVQLGQRKIVNFSIAVP